eukprot:2270130-Amphidinium_carterae.1
MPTYMAEAWSLGQSSPPDAGLCSHAPRALYAAHARRRNPACRPMELAASQPLWAIPFCVAHMLRQANIQQFKESCQIPPDCEWDPHQHSTTAQSNPSTSFPIGCPSVDAIETVLLAISIYSYTSLNQGDSSRSY